MNDKNSKIPDYLFHIAQGFYDTGYHLASQIKDDTTIKGFQRLPAAVVNFSFAVELLLKGLNLITTKLDLQGHQFWNLYKRLPLPVKELIEKKYSENKSNHHKELSAYKIRVTSKNKDDSEVDTDSKDDLTIKELLILHNNSFDNWRYLYEIKPNGYEYEYNFDLMNCFIKALVEVINEIKKSQKPNMVIGKAKKN